MFEKRMKRVFAEYEKLISRENQKTEFYNGIFSRYKNPVLTAEHIPPFWKYDLSEQSNPFFMERLGVNSVFNAGAIYLNGKYCLLVRVEGCDRKSFFAVAESGNGVQGFRFRDYPVILPDIDPEETNVYDMRLTQHEDGYIYGVFCSEKKDLGSSDISAASASAGLVRTRDLEKWERLPNLKTGSSQQRNVVLHPSFIQGQYAFYTRPQSDFLSGGGGICMGLCPEINHPEIKEETLLSKRLYHTITEEKNGEGITAIKGEKGWLHLAHGVRGTAAGLRYVLYAYATSFDDPFQVIAEPGGYFLAPQGEERVGDVSNVVFTNGAIVDSERRVYIYYASSDTRLHVAKTTLEQLEDYIFNTPCDPLRSADCVKQRCDLIRQNLDIINEK